MSGRGRRAALPDGGHSRPESLAQDGADGLVVRHFNGKGQVREYDFGSLPVAAPMRASLAGLFAARCTPARWAAHGTSGTAWSHLLHFTRFVAREQQPPADLDGLTADLLRRWRAAAGSGSRTQTGVYGLLRGDPRLQAGPVADELARRCRAPRSTVQSYSEDEFAGIVTAARRRFRAALQRISDNALHLQRWREGTFAEGSAEWTAGEGLDCLARTGYLPMTAGAGGKQYTQRKYLTALGQASAWRRLFLSGDEAAALGVLLLAEFGWNLSVIDSLGVPLASPDQGGDGHPVYRIPLVKPRRGAGRGHHETRNVADHGAGSPGRLITQALQATRFARAIVEEIAPGTGRLVVWRAQRPLARTRKDLDRQPPVGPFYFGVHTNAAAAWAEAEGLGWGSPFRRGRRTVIAIDRREPAQHSRQTHDRRYALPDRRVQAGAAEVIAAGAEDAAGRARRAVLEARLRDRPAPGDAETATADCAGYRDSPWPSPDGGCGASFLTCLACPNARVHPAHHPRLAHLLEALAGLRSVLPPGAWAADWSDACDRLEDLRDRVGEGPWAAALAAVTAADREIVGHLLEGNLG